MSKTIITISREFGSGGRFIGEQVAKRLGYAYYDKDIIAKVAEASGLAKEYIEEKGEYAPSKNIFSYAFVGRDRTGASLADYLNSIQRQVILKVVEEGPCVIVGRCADYILRDRSDSIHVFIHGSAQAKMERIVNLYSKTEAEAKALLKEVDKCRSVNYNYYTDMEWGKSQNYTMTLNSSEIGIDKCVDIITDLAKA